MGAENRANSGGIGVPLLSHYTMDRMIVNKNFHFLIYVFRILFTIPAWIHRTHSDRGDPRARLPVRRGRVHHTAPKASSTGHHTRALLAVLGTLTIYHKRNKYLHGQIGKGHPLSRDTLHTNARPLGFLRCTRGPAFPLKSTGTHSATRCLRLEPAPFLIAF